MRTAMEKWGVGNMAAVGLLALVERYELTDVGSALWEDHPVGFTRNVPPPFPGMVGGGRVVVEYWTGATWAPERRRVCRG